MHEAADRGAWLRRWLAWLLGSAALVALGAIVGFWAARLAVSLLPTCDGLFGLVKERSTNAPSFRCFQPTLWLGLGCVLAFAGSLGLAFSLALWNAHRAARR